MRNKKFFIKIISEKLRKKLLTQFQKKLFKKIFLINLFIFLLFYNSKNNKSLGIINNIFKYIKTYDGYFPYIETKNYFIYNNLNNYNIVGALKIKNKYKSKLKFGAINPDILYGNITNEHIKGISYGNIITKVKEFNNNIYILLELQKNKNLIIKSEYEYIVNLYYKNKEAHIPLYNKNEKDFGYHYCNHKLDLNKTEIYYYNLSKTIIDNKEYYVLHKSLKSKLLKFILKTEDNNLYNSKDNIIIKNEIIDFYTQKKIDLSKYLIYIESKSILGIFIVYLNIFNLGKYKLYININDKINITTNIIIEKPKVYYINNNKEIDILNKYDGVYQIKGMQEYEDSSFNYKIIFFDLLDENRFKIISYDKQYEINYIDNINYITKYFNISIQIEYLYNNNISYLKLDEINFRFVYNEENEHFSIINQMQKNGEFNIKIKTVKNEYIYTYNIVKYNEINILNPLITIIIPNYNSKNYIDKTIKSILNQTILNYEVIFVDDMSTDGSDKEIEEYVCKDKRFKLIKAKKKLGAPGARNLGLDNMSGKWLKFLDSDDILPRNCLERCINLAFDKNTSNIYFNMEIKNKQHIKEYQSLYYNTDNLDINLRNINNKFFLSSPIKKYRLRQITFSNYQSDSGIEFSLSYLMIIHRLYYTNEILYKVIIRPNSNSRSKNKRLSFLERNPKIYKYKTFLQRKYNLKFNANLRNIIRIYHITY